MPPSLFSLTMTTLAYQCLLQAMAFWLFFGLYCRSGSMSAIAARELVKLDFTNVTNLAGGMVEWEKQGYELIRKP